MNNEKFVQIDGINRRVGDLKHFTINAAKDTPSASAENLQRWDVLQSVLHAWQRMDASVYKDLLDGSSFEYGSHWVKERMCGADAYCAYIKGKFQSMRKSHSEPKATLVRLIESIFKGWYAYAILLKQGKVESLLVFTFIRDKISQMYMMDPELFTFEPLEEHMLDRPASDKALGEARMVAGRHIELRMKKCGKPGPNGFHWIKPEWTFPSFEHFTFAYKNALFPVFVELFVDGRSLMTDQERERFLEAAKEYNLIPCVFRMNVAPPCPPDADETERLKRFTPAAGGWNLTDLRTGKAVDPETLGDETPVEMSAWERLNFACQIVRDHVKKIGWEVLSFCDLPGADPQLWVKDDKGNIGWVIVRMFDDPKDGDFHRWLGFEKRYGVLQRYDGFLAAVSALPADGYSNPESIPPPKLYRCAPFYIRFEGLQRIYVS